MVQHQTNVLIESYVVILHGPPVPPLERHSRWATVNLKDFPSESWHHALEGFVAGSKVRVLRAVKLVRCNDSIVSTDLEHVFGGLRRSTIDGERIVLVVNGTPVFQAGLEGCFDFPILDKILNELRETAGCMVHLLACTTESACVIALYLHDTLLYA